jgi:hypothetical protein
MADSEPSQQQSVGGMADAAGASGNYSNSAITSLHAGQPLPADRNEIGNVPMCADPMGLQWMRDIMAGSARDHFGTTRQPRWLTTCASVNVCGPKIAAGHS